MRRMMTRWIPGAGLTLAMVMGSSAAAASQEPEPFPDGYYYAPANDRSKPGPRDMEGKQLPALQLTDWVGTAQTADDLKGRVVLIDFWATWCGPCRRALPKNKELHEKHHADGLTILGIHQTGRGVDSMRQVLSDAGITYPGAVDVDKKTQSALKVRFFPTYIAVDHTGVIRAAGITPNAVPAVVKALLDERNGDGGANENDDAEVKEPDDAPGAIPAAWIEGGPRRARLAELEAAGDSPALQVTNWINADAMALDQLKGKVVLLDFWATWCGPCKRAIPHTNELQERYRDRGLVIIGVCAARGHEKMADTVREHSIAYPVCADAEGNTTAAYKVDGFPDYYLIDRAGRLRIADCRNGSVEDAIRMLLAEGEGA